MAKNQRFCPNCGGPLDENDKVCGFCNTPVPEGNVDSGAQEETPQAVIPQAPAPVPPPPPPIVNVQPSPAPQVQPPLQPSGGSNKGMLMGIAAVVVVGILGFTMFGGGEKKPPEPKQPQISAEDKARKEQLDREQAQLRAQQEELKRQQEELKRQQEELKRLQEEQIRKKDAEIARVQSTYSNESSKRNAAMFLVNYFKDIDRKDFNSAWSKLHPNQRPKMFASVADFRDGYRTTYSQDVVVKYVEIITPRRARVFFELYAKDKENGRLVPHNFKGRWDVVQENGRYYMTNPNVSVLR